MTLEGVKFLLEGQAEVFNKLANYNAESFDKTKDDYWLGKKQAYTLAAEAFENILNNYLKERGDVDNEN